MEGLLLKAGVYAIINKKLNIVYVGETEVCFLIRWIEHVSRTSKFLDERDRALLCLDKQTEYIILKELNPTQVSRKEFHRYEEEATRFYQNKGWVVVSKPNYSPVMKEVTYENSEGTVGRYKKAVRHMIKIIGLKNTKENNVGRLYAALYKKLNRNFDTDVWERAETNIIDTLTKEELEFILMDLFPRYREKKLSLDREKYRQMERQLSLFE